MQGTRFCVVCACLVCKIFSPRCCVRPSECCMLKGEWSREGQVFCWMIHLKKRKGDEGRKKKGKAGGEKEDGEISSVGLLGAFEKY